MWEPLVGSTEPHRHLVQFYRADERLLTRNLRHYLWDGLRRGHGLVLIATRARRNLLLEQLTALGEDADVAIRERRFVLLDAHDTLARFMTDGEPDWGRFESSVGDAVSSVRALAHQVRAYGEMVGILWQAGQRSAAIRLEDFWNRLLEPADCSLMCGYPIDIFGSEFHPAGVDALLCAHTHLLPAGAGGALEHAISQAMDEILGAGAAGLRVFMKLNRRPSWAVLPKPEAIILWLRTNLPVHAEEILARARQHYDASAALAD